jgi:D-3-phosphoglycerate dehydrogenase / 2-oxoglutarate reductase
MSQFADAPHSFILDATTQLRIAVDMDGVLTEHPGPLAVAANQKFELDLPERAFIDSAGLNVPMDVREWVYGEDGPASRLLPAPGAREFMQKLIRQFGDGNVVIITARPESSASMTVDWFRQQGFPHVNVIFADDKMTIARRQGCGYAVEDSERHARNYAAGGVKCFLIDPAQTAKVSDESAIISVGGFGAILDYLEDVRDLAGRRRTIAEALPPAIPGEPNRRPTIVVSDALHPTARQELEAHAHLIDVDGTDVPALLNAVIEADALVIRSETQVTRDVLAAAKRLRVVARAGVGVDNVDLEAATRSGVVVLNAPGANATSAGEHTIALLLALTRQIPFANASTHAGEWPRKKIKPVDLRGRTVGIVGLGRVGSVVAKRLKAFEMEVIGYDPQVSASRFVELGVEQVELHRLLSRSDIITFHVPSTEDTHHMLNARTLREMKPGVIVLNVARGEVVDQQALAEAVKSGHVAAAGVDVFPHEPCVESPLFGLENVVVTPHTGGSSAEALEAVGRVISSTTLAALRGEAVPNAVNLPPASLEAPALRKLTSVAGAAGHLLSVLSPDLPVRISLESHGLISGDITEHVLNAALAQAFQQWLGRRVTPVNARVIADDLGITVSNTTDDEDEAVLPQFRFEVQGETSHTVVVTWDRTHAGIVEVDRFSLQQPLSGYVLITHHHDQPGVIGQVSTILASYGINIAGMQVGRDMPRGEAMMVTNVDDPISDEALEEIKAATAVEDAFVVSLPPYAQDQDPIVFSTIAATAAIIGK